MNRVEIGADGVDLPAWSASLSDFALLVLERIGADAWDLSILLCGDDKIRELNSAYRGKDEATDVLSFSLGEWVADDSLGKRYLPGDLAISLDTLEENARYFEVSPDEELRRLIIHGILHLHGMDHASNDADEPMLRIQETMLSTLPKERIIP
jgi:probable rRNA maturation factor